MFDFDGRCGLGAVLLCLFLMSRTCHHVQAEISVDAGPQSKTVREGDTVDFVCDLINVQGYTINWSKSRNSPQQSYITSNRHKYSGNNQASPDLINRVSIVGNVTNEEFTLRINNVHEGDSGEYICQYTIPGQVPTNAGSAVLTVQVPPHQLSPLCTVNPAGSGGIFDVGDSVYLNCYTLGGNPRPNVTYTKEDVTVTGPAFSISHLYQLTAEDNGVTFTCTMTTPALDEPRNCSVMPLHILPTVTINPMVTRAQEGADISFNCTGEGVPGISSYIWQVINTDTGETLASNKYTVSDDGRTVDMRVMENIELHCIASVPSGLSSNASARIEVVPREETTESVEMTTQVVTSNQPSSSSTVIAVIVAAAFLFVVVIVVFLLLLWRRRRERKSKIPIDPKVGYTMSDIGDEYDEIGVRNGTTSNAVTTYRDGPDTATVLHDNVLYAQAGKPQQDGRESPSESRPSVPSPYAKRDQRDTTNAVTTMPDSTDSAHHPPPDTSCLVYAQVDKTPKPPYNPNSGKENTYSAVAEDGPVEEADSGMLYADLDLDTHGPNTDKENQPKGPSSSEQTVYAMIRT